MKKTKKKQKEKLKVTSYGSCIFKYLPRNNRKKNQFEVPLNSPAKNNSIECFHNVTAGMLVSQTQPLGIELYFYANTFFCTAGCRVYENAL